MGHEHQKPGAGLAAILLAVLVLFAAGLVIVGVGGWFFLRTSALENAARRQRELAMLEARKAHDLVKRAEAEADAVARAESQLPRLIAIQINADGAIRLEGTLVPADALPDMLKAIRRSERDNPVEGVIHVDSECIARHLLPVADALSKAGITTFRIVDAAETQPIAGIETGAESP